jgi:hypothetical protein
LKYRFTFVLENFIITALSRKIAFYV